MCTANVQLVLAITDPGLRSFLTAQLGLAGQMVIATANHLDQNLSQGIRGNSVLVIEESLIGSQSVHWASTLREHYRSGHIIVVGSARGLLSDDENIYLVDRHEADRTIISLVQGFQSAPD